MKQYSLLASATLAATLGAAAPALADTPTSEYAGSRFSDVWEQVKSDPYSQLPQDRVSIARFFRGAKDLLLEASSRTLSDQSDVLPRFDKLVHPNGVCLSGTWTITAPNRYTGMFRTGTKAQIIARASTALTNTKAGQNRSFGFAGKIFPTDDPNSTELLKTANFFTIEDLGGKRHDHYLDAVNTNDIIKISPSVTAFFQGLEGLTVARDFPKADGSNLSTSLIRELYPLSELGLAPGEEAVTPVWLKIEGAADVTRVDEADFRDELALSNYPDGLRFDITVATEGSRFGDKQWEKIGQIVVNDTVASESCDHRLHFAHPVARKIY